jgi:hypothetical protein
MACNSQQEGHLQVIKALITHITQDFNCSPKHLRCPKTNSQAIALHREVFMNFDPQLVAELNEKKFLAPSSPANSLLSQHRLRIIIENARELLKVR